MKKTALTLAFAIIASLGVAHATAIYSADGFESFTTGALNGQDGWGVDYPEASAVQVQETIVSDGNKAVEITRGASGNSIYVTRAFTGTTGPIVEVTADVRIDSMDSTFDAVYVYKTDVFNDRATILYFRHGGNITTFNGGSEQTISTWTEDTWYDLQFLFDMQAQTYDLYINTSLVADDFGFLNGSTDQITGFTIKEAGGAGGSGTKMQFDNVSITAQPIPEPGSAILVGALTILALGNRFRYRS